MSNAPDGQVRETSGNDAPSTTTAAVPSGNLFATPKLTALDPADRAEQRNVERLLESLDETGEH